MSKQTREGLAALCIAVALLLVGVATGTQAITAIGVVVAVLALGAVAVDLARR